MYKPELDEGSSVGAMAEDGNGSILLKPSMAWGVQEIVKARLIGEIHFLVEFGSEQTLKFVLNGALGSIRAMPSSW